MKSFKRTAMLCVLSSLAGSAARATNWIGLSTTTNDFGNGFNWSTFAAPGSNDTALFEGGPTMARNTVLLSDQRIIGWLGISHSFPFLNWEFTRSGSGSLLVNHDTAIAQGSGSPPTVVFNSMVLNTLGTTSIGFATVSATNSSTISSASFTIDSSTFGVGSSTVSGYLTSKYSTINVNAGGVINSAGLNVGTATNLNVNSGGTLNLSSAIASTVSAGTLTINAGGALNFGTAASLSVNTGGIFELNEGYALPGGKKLEAISGGKINSSGYIDIGNGGAGSLLVSGPGSWINAAGLTDWGFGPSGVASIAFLSSSTGTFSNLRMGSSGGTGTVQIQNASQLVINGSLTVGGSGISNLIAIATDGTLTTNGTAAFNSGAKLTNTAGHYVVNGDATFGTGSTYSGKGMEFASAKTLTFSGVGTFSSAPQINNGATLSVASGGVITDNGNIYLNGPGGGTLRITGAGSKYTTTSAPANIGILGLPGTLAISSNGAGTFGAGLIMGDFSGTGTLDLSSNGTLYTNGFTAGHNLAGSAATVNVNSATWSGTGTASFQNGSTLNVGTGGVVVPGSLSLGSGTGSAGARAFFSNGGYLGTFTTTVLNGATLDLASGATATGNSLVLNGGTYASGATVNISSATLAANVSASMLGAATININPGGYFVASNLTAAGSLSSSSRINIAGGSLNTGGIGTNYNSGAIVNLNSGTYSINGDATFSAGSALNWLGGTLTIASGKTLTLSGITVAPVSGVSLSNGATLKIINGGQFNSPGFYDVANTVAASTGTVTVDGAGSKWTTNGSTDWGRNPGNSATINIQNGGAGTFGGSALRIAANGGTARVNVTGGVGTPGTLTVNTDLTMAGASTLTVNGGALHLNGTAQFNSGAVLQYNGISTLSMANGATFSTGSKFNVTTQSAISIPSGKTLAFNGGAASFTTGQALPAGVTLSVTNGGSFASSSYFDIANSASTGTVSVSGLGSTFSAASVSDWGNITGESAFVSFMNQATGTFATVRTGLNNGTAQLYLENQAVVDIGTLDARAGTNSYFTSYDNSILNLNNVATFGSGCNVQSALGGRIRFNGDTTFKPGSFYYDLSGNDAIEVAAGKTLAFEGALGTFGSATNLGSNATLSVSNGSVIRTLGPIHISTGSLIVKDPGSSIRMDGTYPIFAYFAPDVATVSFTNSAVGTFSSGIGAAYGGGKLVMTIDSNAIVDVHGGMDAAGTSIINLNGGTFLNDAPLVLFHDATMNYAGGAFVMNGHLGLVNNAQFFATPTGNKVVRVKSVGIENTAKVDLTNNAMIIDHDGVSPLGTIQDYIASGYNGGSWTGPGLTSSSAAANAHAGLGFAEASSLLGIGGGTFAGQSVDGTAVLIRYTWLGDSNLDQKVNTIDFNYLAGNFGASGKTWLDGDFNYSGNVDSTDFNGLAANYGKSLLPVPGPELGAVVPEPTGIGLLAICGVIARRRRD
jgi:T5SS/PEP-CTERM-associated repeat protein